MNIEQTCKITLTAEEVREALTAYIRENTRYRTNWKSYDECVSFHLSDAIVNGEPESIVVMWGEVPEEEPAFAENPAEITAALKEAATIAPPFPTSTPCTTSEPAF